MKQNINKKIILERIVSAVNNGEKNEIVDDLKSIIDGKLEKRSFEVIEIEPYSPEAAESAKKIYDKFIVDNKVKEHFDAEKGIEKILDAISWFEDELDPFPYLDTIETIDINEIKTENALNKIHKLNNDLVIITKKQIYEKWKDKLVEIEGLSKYKYANYLECISLLIKAYNCINNIRINSRMCYLGANLVISELVDDFKPMHFFEKYCDVIFNKFDDFYDVVVLRKDFHQGYFKDINIMFIEEFKRQYVESLRPKVKLL
jgi:hypothetical protein